MNAFARHKTISSKARYFILLERSKHKNEIDISVSLVDRNELSSIFVDCDLTEPKGATTIQNLRYVISD